MEYNSLKTPGGTDKIRGIRCPIHEWIHITKEEKNLIDSPYVQRLRRLKQLEFVYLVYPGGDNTRFSHSLGVMHIAGEFACHLWPHDQDRQKLCRIAALLHDIAHGPFSHLWDRTIYSTIYSEEKGHDAHRIYLLENCKDLRARVEKCGVDPDMVIKVWKDVNCPEHDVIQGRIGADRMDYILRDSLFTGMRHYGALSPKRIIANSYIDEETGRVHFHTKVHDEIEMALVGKDKLYKNVYWHKKCQNASKIAEEMVTEAVKSGLPFREMTLDIEKFKDLDESTVFGMILFHPQSTNEKVKELANKLRFRDI